MGHPKKSINRKITNAETLPSGEIKQTLECGHSVIVKSESERHKKREATHRPCRACVLEGKS